MNIKNSIEIIKECEDEADDMIQKAKEEAKEKLIEALNLKESQIKSALDKERLAADQSLKNIEEKINSLVKEKEREEEIKNKNAKELAKKKMPKAVEYILKNLQ
jgi:vacuolar-type H+-ATPase subunit H